VIHELIYTSASTTFDGPGYGVVARTRDIPDALQRHMQRLCRYDFLGADQPRIDPAPEMISHTIVSDGQTWHVLSRTGNAGEDYTFRTVFIAHHVAISDDELGNVSPFDLIQSPQLFRRDWSGEPTILPGRRLSEIRTSSASMGMWRKLFGHDEALQSWGRMHARQLPPLFLLSKNSQENLQMFCEAGRQLNAPQARNVSFITALGADHKGIKFDWIGLMNGSKLAESVMKVAAEKVIDTTRPGKFKPVKSAGPAPGPASGPSRPAPPAGGSPVANEQRATSEPDAYELCWQEEIKTSTMPQQRRAGADLPPPPPPVVKSKSLIPVIAGSITAVIAIGFLVVVLMKPGAPTNTVAKVPEQTADNKAGANAGVAPVETDEKDQAPGAAPRTAVDGTGATPPGPKGAVAEVVAPAAAVVWDPRIPLIGQVSLEKGLLEADAAKQWVTIARLPEGLKFRPANLLGDGAFGLALNPGNSPEASCSISSAASPQPAIELQVTKGNEIQIRFQGNPDRVVKLLRLCSLRFEADSPVTVYQEGKSKYVYDLSFNTRHPALLVDRKFDPNVYGHRISDISEFYQSASEVANIAPEAKILCRIDRVALVPGSGLEVTVEPQEVVSAKILTFPVTMPYCAGSSLESDVLKLQFKLQIQPYFNRDQSEWPLKLLPLDYEGKGVAKKIPAPDDKAATPDPKDSAGAAPADGKATKPKSNSKKAGQKDHQNNKSSSLDNPSNEPSNEPPANQAAEEPKHEGLRSVGNEELVSEVFYRFGSVSGVLLMQIKQGVNMIEYPLVHFDHPKPATPVAR
jgi:hypothetical protein